MRKSTINRIGAIFVILIFGMSSIAFVVSGIGGFGIRFSDDNVQSPTLDSFVVRGDIDPNIEFNYVQSGFTFLKYYYADESGLSYIEGLPERFTTNNGQIQLIVVEIPDDRESVLISNLNGIQEVEDTSDDGIFNALCNYILLPPAECAFGALFENSTE